jgi:hypothetical protein
LQRALFCAHEQDFHLDPTLYEKPRKSAEICELFEDNFPNLSYPTLSCAFTHRVIHKAVAFCVAKLQQTLTACGLDPSPLPSKTSIHSII